MTYPEDPKLRRPGYTGTGAGAWIGGLVAVLVIVGLIVWATGVGRDADVAGTPPPTAITTTPPATTGTGSTTGAGPAQNATPTPQQNDPPAQPR